MHAPQMGPERLCIPGPAGLLEVLPEPGAGRALVVICHPHPLYGGSLDNKVVHTLARAARACGAHTLRFNFRGVGRSEGVHADGTGEVEDLAAVAAWGGERHAGLPLHLAGFSFGSAIALRAAGRLDARSVLLVAPPVERLPVPGAETVTMPVALIHGDADTLIPLAEVRRWAGGKPLTVIPGAEHFFHGQLAALREAAVAFWQPLFGPP